MLRILKKNKGQSHLVEYTVTFFLVVAFVSGIAVYVRRATLARMRDFRAHMLLTLQRTAPSNIVNAAVASYEPYYVEQEMNRWMTMDSERRLLRGLPGSSGIFEHDSSERRKVEFFSNQLPAKEAR